MPAAAHTAPGRRAFDAIVVAASLGGPRTLASLLPELPADFPVPVLLVQHRTPTVEELFLRALRGRCRLPVRMAADGQPVETSGITLIPARQTAALDPHGRIRLRISDSFRLADPLFISVAERYGPGALGVVLTGRLDDGTLGVRALKRHGGRAIVEDPTTARAPAMPLASLATGCVDLVMPSHRIGHAVIALTMAPGAAELFRVPPTSWANLAA